MDLLVDIKGVVIAQVLQHHTRDVFLGAIAPLHEERVTLKASRTGCISIASQRKLVCIAAEPSVGDFGRTLVGRLCGKGEAKKESYDKQQLSHRCNNI